MNMIEKQFMRLVLGALYVIMMTQQGYRMSEKFHTWGKNCDNFLEVLGE